MRRSDVIEVIARALCRSVYVNPDQKRDLKPGFPAWTCWEDDATKVYDALKNAGALDA